MNNAAYIALKSIYLLLGVSNGQQFPPPLGKREEYEEFKKMSLGDNAARAKLIEHNLRLVVHIIKKYYANNSDQDDLISIGTIGLIKGINSFRPDKNVRLATYCSRCIENAILSLRLLQKRKLPLLNT